MPDHRPLLFCCQEDVQAGRPLGRLTRSARFGSAQAIIRGGEPMQLQLWKDFLPAIAPLLDRPMLDMGRGRFTNGVMIK
jgi:hypothetical protein